MKTKQEQALRTRKAKVAPMTGRIHERAMLIYLSIGFWDGKKKDKEKTSEFIQASKAEADAGSWWTRAVPADATAPIVNARLRARKIHLQYTLPWLNDGTRILPSAMYMKYTAEMRAAKAEYEKEVEAFLAKYPDIVKTAPKRLGKLFKVDMLPSPKELRDRYTFETNCWPVPTSADFRVKLGDAAAAEIRRGIERDTRAALEKATGDLWHRLHEAVNKIAEKMGDPDAIFRDSLLANAVELCELLPALNVTGDPTLEEARQQVIKKFAKQDPDVLRKNKAVRADAAKAAGEITKRLASYLPQTK